MNRRDSDSACSGLVLAGGRAERLGGVEKGLMDWQGRPLVVTAIDALSACCQSVAISANREGPTYATLADAVLADAAPFTGAGPLAGILAGLEWASDAGYSGLLTIPCDTPYVDAAIMQRLWDAARHSDGRLTVARVAGRLHPLHGYFPVTAAGALRAFLQAGSRKVGVFLAEQAVQELDLPVAPATFHNLNTPGDWRDAP